MGHLGGWVEVWRAIAQELAVEPKSPAFDRLTEIGRDWDARGRHQRPSAGRMGGPVDGRGQASFLDAAGELRGYLTVVPEARWLKDSAHLKSLLGNTTEHYDENGGFQPCCRSGALIAWHRQEVTTG